MQSKLGSLTEAVFNILIGYTVAVAAQALIFPFFGVYLPVQDHLAIGALFTVVSLVRSYVIRRVFNKYNFFGGNK